MTIKTKEQIIKDWGKDIFENLYLLTGEEFFLKEEIIEYLKKKFSSNYFDFFIFSADGVDINSLIMDFFTIPVSFKKRVIVLKRVHKIKAEPFKKFMEYLKHPSDTSSLVVCYDKKITSKDAVYDEFINLKGVLCEFNPLEPLALKEYVFNKFSINDKFISDEGLQLLLEITDNNLAILSQEIEKLILYSKGRKEITTRDILESAGGIKGENPFKIVNLILENDIKNLERLVNDLIADKTEPLWIVSLFLNALDKMLKILIIEKNDLWDNNKMLYSLGVYKSDAFKVKYFRNIGKERILALINKCLEVEYLLKTSSGRNPELLIKNLIYQMKH